MIKSALEPKPLHACIVDIEECEINKDNCHMDANCSNTKGSFYCTCHTGYSGDGVLCNGMLWDH